jgi:DNA-binding NtrC family response regulator
VGAAWPGNVRELRNAVEAASVFGDAAVAAATPGAPTPGPDDFHAAKERVVSAFERSYLENLLRRHSGNLAAVAREAGIGRSHLYRLLEAHGLEPTRYR